jgi:hypothetical protein
MKSIHRLILFVSVVSASWSGIVEACTIFSLARDGQVWFGANEDTQEAALSLWTVPAGGGHYGVMNIGFSGEVPACGINDQGLCFDLASVPFKYSPLDSRKSPSDRFIVQKVLEECADVAEALDTLARYNIEFLSQLQIMLADKSGTCAIVESDSIILSRGGLRVITNFRHSEAGADTLPCDRYRAVRRVLENRPASLEAVRSAVAAASVGDTQYSVAFDLKNGQVYIWLFHNYADYVKLDLRREIAGGPYIRTLSEIFPYETVSRNRYVKNNKRPEYKPVTLGGACLDSLVGMYAIAPGYNMDITRRGDSLFCRMFGLAPYAIIPASSRQFFFQFLPAEILFIEAPGAGIDSLRLKYSDVEIPAARLK